MGRILGKAGNQALTLPLPPRACRSRRHHFCEGRPLGLFLLHAGYHALVLAMCCCALAEFGRPNAAGGGGSGSGGGPAATARAKHEL